MGLGGGFAGDPISLAHDNSIVKPVQKLGLLLIFTTKVYCLDFPGNRTHFPKIKMVRHGIRGFNLPIIVDWSALFITFYMGEILFMTCMKLTIPEGKLAISVIKSP